MAHDGQIMANSSHQANTASKRTTNHQPEMALWGLPTVGSMKIVDLKHYGVIETKPCRSIMALWRLTTIITNAL